MSVVSNHEEYLNKRRVKNSIENLKRILEILETERFSTRDEVKRIIVNSISELSSINLEKLDEIMRKYEELKRLMLEYEKSPQR